MATDLDFQDHLWRESARFRAVLADADPAAQVPTCPDWNAADLLWHLAEVQLFWGAIVRDRLDDPDRAEAAKPERPGEYPELLELFDRASAALLDTLATTPDHIQLWTWFDADQSAGFVRRRQAHEALIHRLDAELITGSVTGIDAALATDGVDEALSALYGGPPAWGSFTSSSIAGRVRTTDTGGEWLVELGRFTGTSPNTGTSYDEPSLTVATNSGPEPTFTVSASARDLDAWVWNRPTPDGVRVEGSDADFARFEAVIVAGVQ